MTKSDQSRNNKTFISKVHRQGPTYYMASKCGHSEEIK